MLVVFPANFVADTKMICDYDSVAPLMQPTKHTVHINTQQS